MGNKEFANFNRAMDTILNAKPEIVKQAMELEKEDRAKRRKAKSSSLNSKTQKLRKVNQ
jgi:hypothetical protein